MDAYREGMNLYPYPCKYMYICLCMGMGKHILIGTWKRELGHLNF